MHKYVVIGGQYYKDFYGVFDGMHAAKIFAHKHVELWDNWQGLHTPCIFRLEDCEYIEHYYDLYGCYIGMAYMPKPGAPYWCRGAKGWEYIDY